MMKFYIIYPGSLIGRGINGMFLSNSWCWSVSGTSASSHKNLNKNDITWEDICVSEHKFLKRLQCFANESAVAHFFITIFAGCSYQICLKIVTLCHTRSQALQLHNSALWSLMASFTTPELRNSMVVWRYEQRKTILEISKLARCSERTVYDVLRLSTPRVRPNCQPICLR